MSSTPRELETAEAFEALAAGAIWIEAEGSENTYYADEFGNAYFCKNYPR